MNDRIFSVIYTLMVIPVFVTAVVFDNDLFFLAIPACTAMGLLYRIAADLGDLKEARE